jgi:hypothetical protein
MQLNSFCAETGKEWNSREVLGKALCSTEIMSVMHVCRNVPCTGCEVVVGENNEEGDD